MTSLQIIEAPMSLDRRGRSADPRAAHRLDDGRSSAGPHHGTMTVGWTGAGSLSIVRLTAAVPAVTTRSMTAAAMSQMPDDLHRHRASTVARPGVVAAAVGLAQHRGTGRRTGRG